MPKNAPNRQPKPQSFSEAWGWDGESDDEAPPPFGRRAAKEPGGPADASPEPESLSAQGITRGDNAAARQRSLNQAAARAARRDDAPALGELLKNGANPLSSVMGRELAMAAERSSEAVVALLLADGAGASEFVGLALRACARRGFESFELALNLARSEGVWIGGGAIEDALKAASRDDQFFPLAREFLALGANPNGAPPGERHLAPPTGESPLELAAHRGAHAVLRLLIEAGAKEHLNSALACALSMGQWISVDMLEAAGAKIDESNVLISLHAEDARTSEKAAQWILARGVNPERVAAAALATGFDNWGAFEAAIALGARGQTPQSPWRMHWERNAREGGALERKAKEAFGRIARREREDLLVGLDEGQDGGEGRGKGESGSEGRGARRL